MTSDTNIAVLGSGAWGTALANMLADQARVTLWGRDTELIADIEKSRINARYLPQAQLKSTLHVTSNWNTALSGADIVLLVTPVRTTHAIGENLLSTIGIEVPIVCCSKGIDPHLGKTPTQLLIDLQPEANLFALSGPSFAADVVAGLPTAVALAHDNIESANALSRALSRRTFRIYASDDLAGVELGGALKNVIALAVGVCRGLQLGASAEASVMARGFAELTRLVTALGGKSETLAGLSGLGDLVLSCSNKKSRNFSYGIALGRGAETRGLALAEGVRTAPVAKELAQDNNMDCPIIAGVSALIENKIEPESLVEALLARPLTSERG